MTEIIDWAEPMKTLCRGRCADMGGPPCWQLPDLYPGCDGVEPCQECQADRIAELEAENARLRKGLERIGMPCAFYLPTAHVDPEVFARMIYADKIRAGESPETAGKDTEAETWKRYPARAAPQENDNG